MKLITDSTLSAANYRQFILTVKIKSLMKQNLPKIHKSQLSESLLHFPPQNSTNVNENKENSQNPFNEQNHYYLPHDPQQFRKKTSPEHYLTIKKMGLAPRQSEYYGENHAQDKNLKFYRFSQHAERIKSTNINLDFSHDFSQTTQTHLTFGTIRESITPQSVGKQLKKVKKQVRIPFDRCFNHFNREAKFYLLLAEKESDGGSNKLFYCERCAINIKQQGFTIHPIPQKTVESPLFLKKLDQSIKKIQKGMNDLANHPYLYEINQKANEVTKKYDNIMEMLLQFKKQELMQLEKYKFEVFEYVTRKQKQLEGTLKKFQLLYDSYLKHCDFEEVKQQGEHKLYWTILEKEEKGLEINIGEEISKIKLNGEKFIDELQICEKLVFTFKQRVYQLSFEEDSEDNVYNEKSSSNILDGLNATFGEKENDFDHDT